MKLYGIKNCDTVKKARAFLDGRGVDYTFVDFRADGLSQKQVSAWLKKVPVDQLINKRSTTWKQLDESDKQRLNDSSESKRATAAAQICTAHPTLIKRPVLKNGDEILVGFKPDAYETLAPKR